MTLSAGNRVVKLQQTWNPDGTVTFGGPILDGEVYVEYEILEVHTVYDAERPTDAVFSATILKIR